jgi:hypothetical protein
MLPAVVTPALMRRDFGTSRLKLQLKLHFFRLLVERGCDFSGMPFSALDTSSSTILTDVERAFANLKDDDRPAADLSPHRQRD